MAEIFIELPSLLRQVIDTDDHPSDHLKIEASTFAEALALIRSDYPKLAVHVFNEQGEFREHVLCFLNDQNSRWLDDDSVKLNDGDRLLIMQAVSGG